MIEESADRQKSSWLLRGHRDQRGAMMLLALAAILLIVMVGLVLFDVAELGTEKTHIQTATDASAYSQATVEAQSMNMVAFANTGKRMTIGMVNSYIAIVQWLTWLGQIATIVQYASYALYAVGMGAVAQQLEEAASAIRDLQSQEEDVRSGAIASKRAKCHYKRFRCSTSGCGWRCRRRYDETPTQVWEWAAPEVNNLPPILLPPYNAMGCGKRPHEFTASLFRPLSCADGDIYNWNPQALIENYYGRDLLAYDNYQRYIISIAPYWAWTEGATRGLLNAAPVTLSFPMPEFGGDQAAESTLPLYRGEFDDTCARIDDADRGLTHPMALDYAASNILGALDSFTSGGNITLPAGSTAGPSPGPNPGTPGVADSMGRIIGLIVAGVMTFQFDPPTGYFPGQFFPRPWEQLCTDITGELLADAESGGGFTGIIGGGGGGDYVDGFRDYGAPYLINEYGPNQDAQWLLDSSNLMIGFRPNASRMDEGRGKYFVGGDHTFGDGITEMGRSAGGTWAMARGEMAFQDGSPNAWSPAWSARLRPVALPGEWDGYDEVEMADTIDDLAEPLARTTVTAHGLDEMEDIISHPHNDFNTDILDEFGAIRMAVEGLTNERMQGVAK